MAELLFSIDVQQWDSAGSNYLYETTASAVMDEEMYDSLMSDKPTVIITFNDVDYECVAQDEGEFGIVYGDLELIDMPFNVDFPGWYSGAFAITTTSENAVPMTVSFYKAGKKLDDCDWKEGIVLNPPEEEECIPCEEIADLDERVTTLENSEAETTTVTILTTDWSSDTATVTVEGVTSSNTVIVSPDPSNASAYAEAGILCTAQGTDTLTFTCATVPSQDIVVNIVII